MADDWRYLAYRMRGDGQQGEQLADDLPLTGVQITDVLSGPPLVSGSISPSYSRYKAADGRPLLDEWSTVIYPERSGQIETGAIYRKGGFDGPQWSLSCAGFSAYPTGMGYEGEYITPGGVAGFVNADPLDVVRHIWDHIQSGLYSNLGLTVDDSTTSSVRIGTPSSADTSSTTDGPFQLNWWSTPDLGKVIDDLAKSTPFDYHERHFWNQARTQILHELVFGTPRLGERRKERFVFGENIQTVPSAARDGEAFANHVRLLGAGEGRAMVMRESRMNDGRLRRMVTVDDKSVDAGETAQRRARQELTARQLLTDVTSVVCWDTPQTPAALIVPGNEYRLQGELDWVDVDMWVRVVSKTITPDNAEVYGLSLVRADAV